MRGPHDSTGDEASVILTPPPSPLSLDHQPPAHPCRPPLERQISKTRRYTNVVCCPDMLTANVSPRTRGPWPGMLPPTLSIVSDPSTPQAELLALLAVPHSAMSVGAAWNRVATSVWWPVVETREWNCGTQCEMWGVPLVCLFHNPILVSIVAPLELGLGIHNPRFVAGPLEVGLGTRNSRFVAWPLELGLGTRSPRFVAWPLELGLGTRNARSHVAMCAN